MWKKKCIWKVLLLRFSSCLLPGTNNTRGAQSQIFGNISHLLPDQDGAEDSIESRKHVVKDAKLVLQLNIFQFPPICQMISVHGQSTTVSVEAGMKSSPSDLKLNPFFDFESNCPIPVGAMPRSYAM